MTLFINDDSVKKSSTQLYTLANWSLYSSFQRKRLMTKAEQLQKALQACPHIEIIQFEEENLVKYYQGLTGFSVPHSFKIKVYPKQGIAYSEKEFEVFLNSLKLNFTEKSSGSFGDEEEFTWWRIREIIGSRIEICITTYNDEEKEILQIKNLPASTWVKTETYEVQRAITVTFYKNKGSALKALSREQESRDEEYWD